MVLLCLLDLIPSLIKSSFEIASSGRPGPIVIDVPKEVQEAELTGFDDSLMPTPGYNPTIKGNIKQIKKAKELNMLCLGLSGKGGGKMNELCDHNLVVPSDDTARIQEMHILIIHTLCQIIDEGF